MQIYDVLKQDHDRVKGILKRLGDTDENDASARERLLASLKEELEIHARFEEEVFYPAVAERKEAKDAVADAIDEHDEAMSLADEIEDMDSGSAEWTETLANLSDVLNCHMEEEETEIFALARETIDPDRAVQMAKDYERQKAEWMKLSG